MNFRSMVATVLVVSSFLMAGCAGGNTPPPAPATKVTMDELEYLPKDVAVKTGESVMWENTASITHTVTWDDASMASKNSASMNKGGKHTVKFDSVGTFAYHCAIPGHATQVDGKWTGMTGNVTVTA